MSDFYNGKWIYFKDHEPEFGSLIVCVFDKSDVDNDFLGIVMYCGEKTGYGSNQDQSIVAWIPIPNPIPTTIPEVEW